jgi:nucleotide-binding universal stress UspA family protein
MFQRILVPLDGSSLAEQVLPLTKIFAVRFQSEVVLLRVVEPIRVDMTIEGKLLSALDLTERACQSARDYLETIHGKFPTGVSVTCKVKSGASATTILDLAENSPFDLIAMATHGNTGLKDWVHGSVADKILSSSQLPILLVRPTREHRALTQVKRILVPLDGSPLSECALKPAQQLAQTFDAEIILFRALESIVYATNGSGEGAAIVAIDEKERQTIQTYLADQVKEFKRQGIRVSSNSEDGVVAEKILESAHKRQVNLIVMSTHGRAGLGRWIMGSVTDRVLRSSPVPVLVIRAGARTK